MPTDILSELEAACPPPWPGDEWRLRVQLAACYRVFDQLGWTELVFNHITVRVPGAQPAYLINPFGLNYAEVTARNLILVGLDGRPLAPTEHPVNRAGFVIHSALHGARADAHCVMHTHTTAGMAVACKPGGLGHDDFYGAELFGASTWTAYEWLNYAVPIALRKAQPGTAQFRTALRDALETMKNVVTPEAVYTMSPTNHNGADQRSQVLVRIVGGTWKLAD